MTYTTVDTPYGPLLLVASDAGLVRIAFELEGFDEVLASFDGPLHEATGGPACAARVQLEEYFAGERDNFELDLDLSGIDGFRRSALEEMAAIPYGETRTYRELAQAA